ncbi:E3 ubiquitin ligase [Marasmius sp. AFHP31]|nr:E3 ubiquitin ligase [Marasmius sp. AFHP31]KAK1233627.1 E3 ubiquitin ligase [Marasmius sp. AFHP31]
MPPSSASPRNATARSQSSQTTADYSASHSEDIGSAGQNLSDDGSCVENVEQMRQDVNEPMNTELYEENETLHADRAKLLKENEVLIAARDQLTKELISLQSQLKSHEDRPELVDLEPHTSCKICLDRLRAPYVLSCGHSFCRTCLKAMFEFKVPKHVGMPYPFSPSATPYSCPVCRSAVVRRPIPNFDLKSMISDFTEIFGETEVPRKPEGKKERSWEDFFGSRH